MKKLIILGGNSAKNKKWSEAMAEYYGSLADETYVQEYDHWTSGAETINFDIEAEKLRTVVLEDTDAEYTIFAKSFGSILALLSVYKGYITPKQCIFFGMPFSVVEEQNLFDSNWSFVSEYSVPAIAFHNINDPVAKFDVTSAKIAELKPSIQLIALEGDTHAYDVSSAYEDKIKEFLGV